MNALVETVLRGWEGFLGRPAGPLNVRFVDGNKLAALAAMLVFLEINGHSLRVPQEDLYAMMISLASGRLSKAGLTAWLRERLGLAAEGSRSE